MNTNYAPLATIDPQSISDDAAAEAIEDVEAIAASIPDDGLVPQANSVPKVLAVVDAVTEGCSSAAEIAEAIGFCGRQGAYYVQAARSLGLVDLSGGWAATREGADLAGADAPERCRRICAHIGALPYIQAIILEGREALRQAWSALLSDTTVERRIATAEAWAAFYTMSTSDQIRDISTAAASTRTIARLIVVRRAEAEARRPQRRHCPICYLDLPTGSDECGNCD